MRKLAFLLLICICLLVCAGCASQTAALLPTSAPDLPSPTNPPLPTNTAIPPSPTNTPLPTNTPVPPTPTITSTPTETPIPPGVVVITWALRNPNYLAENFQVKFEKLQKTLVNNFNQEYTGKIFVKIVPYDLAARPDVLGPTIVDDVKGSSAAGGEIQELLDLGPYFAEYDVYQLFSAPNSANLFSTENGPVGMPVCVVPPAMYYDPKSFESAGLNLPPESHDQKYIMPDGSEVEWSFDTVAKVARLLTLDKNGKNATQSGFDRNNVAIYGLSLLLPSTPGSFLPGAPVGFFAPTAWRQDGKVTLPASLKTGWKWVHEGLWGKQPFINPQDSFDTTGKIDAAMVLETGLVAGNLRKYRFAPLPSMNGAVYGQASNLSEGMFIFKETQHPQEAFTLLMYVLKNSESQKFCDSFSGNGLGQLTAMDSWQSARFKRWNPNVNYTTLQTNQAFLPLYPLYMQSESANAILAAAFSQIRSLERVNFEKVFSELQTALQEEYDKKNK